MYSVLGSSGCFWVALNASGCLSVPLGLLGGFELLWVAVGFGWLWVPLQGLCGGISISISLSVSPSPSLLLCGFYGFAEDGQFIQSLRTCLRSVHSKNALPVHLLRQVYF